MMSGLRVDSGFWNLRGWYDDVAAALQFMTRLAVLPGGGVFSLARGARVLPLVGLVLGAGSGGLYWILRLTALPALAAAILALGLAMLASGGLHEDGLADTADGFGGGRTAEKKLAIMSDSRIGSYGVLALLATIGLKTVCLAALSGPQGFAALVLAHVWGRTAMVFLPIGIDTARPGGLGASVQKALPGALMIAGILALAISLAFAPAAWTAIAIAVAAAAITMMRTLARALIGGYTGDVLGASEQLCEVAILIAAAALP